MTQAEGSLQQKTANELTIDVARLMSLCPEVVLEWCDAERVNKDGCQTNGILIAPFVVGTGTDLTKHDLKTKGSPTTSKRS